MTDSTAPEVRWDRMTAPALIEAARDKTVVIVPIGATEQHGPHLPTQVDWRLAYEVSLRAARQMQGRQRALVTPAILLFATLLDTLLGQLYTCAPMTDVVGSTRPRPFLWWGIAIAVILLGFADLARGGETIAPILLVIGYCVLVPVAILK